MKVLVKEEEVFYLRIIPRFYFLDKLVVIIREPITNITITIDTSATYEKGLLSIDLRDFLPINDTIYSIVVRRVSDGSELTIWTGQALYTEKDRLNYSLNNSDENNLRF